MASKKMDPREINAAATSRGRKKKPPKGASGPTNLSDAVSAPMPRAHPARTRKRFFREMGFARLIATDHLNDSARGDRSGVEKVLHVRAGPTVYRKIAWHEAASMVY